MKTIIQTIGPLYGDDANGTVFGQPNGSVYTPPASYLTEIPDTSITRVRNVTQGNVISCDNAGTSGHLAFVEVVAQVPFDVIAELATDATFATVVSSFTDTTVNSRFALRSFGTGYTVVNGTTYYARARVVTKSGHVTFLTTNTYTVTGLV